MNVKMNEPITLAGSLKEAAGDMVGDMASLGVISASVYGLYKTQPGFKEQADKIVKDAIEGLAARTRARRAPAPSDSMRIDDQD
jgi:hypothetical protein